MGTGRGTVAVSDGRTDPEGLERDFRQHEQFMFLLPESKTFCKITLDTSLRLAKLFGASDEYFINMQNDIDIRMQKRKQ